jgi:hypothetical protein
MPPKYVIQSSRRPGRRLLALCLTFVWLGLVLVALVNRQNILDRWKLHNYTAPAAVAQIAAQDTMTSYARKVFYVNTPALESKATFKQCPANGEQTIVLGCYRGGQNGIYLLSVSDARLAGVEQVTAAHEMLHAAYDRLSTKQRAAVDAMLEDYYQHDLSDARIKATIDAYKQTEPNDLVNEMHSIFGTEIASLPAPLESYYQQYFTNRQAVASFAAQYQAEFTSREDTVKADDAQLASWKTQIESAEADLKAKRADLDAQSQRLQAERSGNNISAYNAGVPGYNASVNAYNADVDSLQALVSQYNSLVQARNAVAQETEQLTNEINSQAQTINQ